MDTVELISNDSSIFIVHEEIAREIGVVDEVFKHGTKGSTSRQIKIDVSKDVLKSILDLLQSENNPYQDLRNANLGLSDLFAYLEIFEMYKINSLIQPIERVIKTTLRDSKYGHAIMVETANAIVSLQDLRRYQYIVVRMNWFADQKNLFQRVMDYIEDELSESVPNTYEDGVILAYVYNNGTGQYEIIRGPKFKSELENYYRNVIKNLPDAFIGGSHGGFMFEDTVKNEAIEAYRSFVKNTLLGQGGRYLSDFENLDMTIIPINFDKDLDSWSLIADLPLKIIG